MYPVLLGPKLANPTFTFNPNLLSDFSTHQDFTKDIEHDDIFLDASDVGFNPNIPWDNLSGSVFCSDSVEVPDFSDACLKFISDILLEEDLDESPASVHQNTALEATEKSLYDILGEDYSPSYVGQSIHSSVEGFESSCGYPGIEGCVEGDITFELNWMFNCSQSDPILTLDDIIITQQPSLDLNSLSSGSSNSVDDSGDGAAISPGSTVTSGVANRPRRKKNHKRDENGYEEGGRSNKQQASASEDYVEMKEYDDVLLGKEEKEESSASIVANEKLKKKNSSGSKGKTRLGKKQNMASEEVDLRTLLSHCAQAVSGFDLRTANELLKQIRQHSSPYGDNHQRLAHYFANGLEARLAGTGSTVFSDLVDTRISSSDYLKAYKLYVSAIPFKRMFFCVANNAILKFTEKASTIHIIDFGVLLGLQWPCFIQNLSKRGTPPPRLRITGIEYPQHGFRPAEKVEATGRRLAGYCERFNVPFRYKGIAQHWESIKVEDLEIERDELVIVNCFFRSGILLDETVVEESPRDGFLRLIKEINPSLFVHGTINGSYNAPFFITRFREALFHYSSIFDICEATMSREDSKRMVIESELYGKEAFNVIACEGAERIQRPETYKQWQVRSRRAGLRQLPLDREMVDRAKSMVKANYHKDFVVDEDKHWLLQGWKGRIFCALSFWGSD